MRFERDEQAGITLLVNSIAQGIFILVTIGICIKVMKETPPRPLMAVMLIAFAIYMLIRILYFIHLRNLWKNAYFETDNDRARGFAADGKLLHGAAFDIPAGSVEKAELTTVPMTRKTPLNALKLTTDERTYYIVGLIVDEETRRVFQLN